jgi:phosphoglucosamine mutase
MEYNTRLRTWMFSTVIGQFVINHHGKDTNMEKADNFFGTDGIRGKVGEYPITVDFVLKLGWAVGMMLSSHHGGKVLIGKDTRISGYMIESALQAGLSSAGSHIYLVGPMPTPAIAYLTRAFRAEIGIVISASHNPYDDNGIKFFSSDGYKISAEMEQTIAYWVEQPIKTSDSSKLGKAWRIDDAQGRYIEFCKGSVPHHTNLEGLKIVIDCANGSTYHIAPHVFSELGANVILMHASPNGFNINKKCGSIHPDVIRARVLEEKADLGIAFDGDGDRTVMVDHRGEILDGDELLYIIAKSLLASKRLIGGVIGTTMSNMGLELALNELGIHFSRASVGDQHILAGLRQKNWFLGGETSGHIIYLDVSTCADGIVTALQVLQAVFNAKKNLHELKQGMHKFPQCIINIPHNGKRIDLNQAAIVQALAQTEATLGKRGRVLVRYSGTEPVIRVMVEGEDKALVNQLATHLVTTINQAMP